MANKYRFRILVTLLLGFALGSLNAQTTFEQTLNIHLNAIRQANLKAFEPTVSDSVLHISPMGDMRKSKKAFMQVHEDWFKRNNWQWEGNVVETHAAGPLGYALIKYTYLEKDKAGKITFQIKSYLTLIFKNSDKGWQLVYDQNTAIAG